MRILFLLGLAVLGACASEPSAPQSEAIQGRATCAPSERIDPLLQAALDPIVDQAHAEGFAGGVALMREGAVVYSRLAGSADLAGHVPVTDATLFHVASITKYFTAALALRAIEEGRLRLDQPVAPLLGGDIVPASVTIEDLLAHRSGLGSSYAAEQTTTQDEAIRAIDEQPYDSSKVGAFTYSNDGYDLLAIILERTYGQSYETLVRTKLATPACLSHLGFWGELDVTDPHVRAQGNDLPGSNLLRRTYGMIGSAGLMITAVDLAAWQSALDRGLVLSPASLAALYAPRGQSRAGAVSFGSFLAHSDLLGDFTSARGAEDWGDNAYLNGYRDCGFIVAIVTSRGPAENSGRPLFRDSLREAIEPVLAQHCRGS